MNTMELRPLRYFVAVVEAGSLTAAAEALHLSQPSLSVAIAKLEADIGVALLVRSARGAEPTSAGRFLVDSATRLLAEVDDLSTALHRFGTGTAGSLTFAAVPVLMWDRVPRLLRAHATEAPDVEIRLVDPPPWTALELLRQRSVDLAAVMVSDPVRFVQRHGSDFDIVDWGEIPLVAVLPPEEFDAPQPFAISGFDAQLVHLPRRSTAVPSLPEAVEAAFAEHGVQPIIRTADTIQTSIPLIEAGLGRAILPNPDGTSLSRFAVTVRQLAPAVPPLRALVLSRSADRSDPALARLLRRIATSIP